MSIFEFEKALGVALVVIIVAISSLGGYLWYVESRDIPTQRIASQGSEESVVLEGTYVCLPRTDGSRASECTPGLKVGEDYYALDMAIIIGRGVAPSLSNGMKILAGGVVVPLEEVIGDQWDVYPVKGVMQMEEVARQ